jgi:hypothetical protein
VPALLDEEMEYAGQDKRIKTIPGEGGLLCSFLNPDDNKCRIYPRRPFECQLYPFLINRKGRRVFLAIDLNCPFAKEGLSRAGFQEYAVYLGDFLNQPPQSALLKNSPQILQSYAGMRDLLQLGIEL